MKNLLGKLRISACILKMRLEIFWSNITAPFKIFIACCKRYLLIRKIYKESEDGWERHVKLRELENQDNFKLRRQEFFILKAQLIGGIFRTGMSASFYILLPEDSNSALDYESKLAEEKNSFEKEKAELIELLSKLDNFSEIKFDEELKAEILAWEIDTYKSTEEIRILEEKFANHLQTLDLVP